MTHSQCLVFGVSGPQLTNQERKIIKDVQPGGFILFTRNIESPTQLRDLMEELRSLVKVEPILTIDQEGGRVSRLKAIGKEPPNANQLRDKADPTLIQRHGSLTGQILRQFGFNLNLCPVVDISFDDTADNSLKGRTWGKSPAEVTRNAKLFADAMRAHGILSCGKHFPAYSACSVDPHHHMPIVERNYEELYNCEWIPYRELRESLDSVMIGHAYYPKVDKSRMPATFSSHMIRKVLREDLGFEGTIISDDLDMGAVTENYSFRDSIRLSIEAGNDILLVCHRIELAYEAAEECEKISADIMSETLSRIATFKAKLAPAEKLDLKYFEELNSQIFRLREDTLGAEEAAKDSPEDGKRSPVEIF